MSNGIVVLAQNLPDVNYVNQAELLAMSLKDTNPKTKISIVTNNEVQFKNLFDTSKKIYVVYDAVEGLEPSSSVKLKGVTVGRVNSYNFLDNKKVLVELSITSNYPISKSSVGNSASSVIS